MSSTCKPTTEIIFPDFKDVDDSMKQLKCVCVFAYVYYVLMPGRVNFSYNFIAKYMLVHSIFTVYILRHCTAASASNDLELVSIVTNTNDGNNTRKINSPVYKYRGVILHSVISVRMGFVNRRLCISIYRLHLPQLNSVVI